MQQTEITFEGLPKAVARLIAEVAQLRESVQQLGKPPSVSPRPIGIDQACTILMKARSTVYALVRRGQIPCCKIGKKLYFSEKELLEWIAQGKKKSVAETKADIEAQLLKGIKHKPKSLTF